MKDIKTLLYTAVFVIGYFLTTIFGNSLCNASENNINPSDKLFIAVKNNDIIAANQTSDELIKMGNDAIPLLKEKINLENKALTGRVMYILRNIKTNASTEMLLDMCVRGQSVNDGEYIIREIMQELPNRDIDVDVNESTLNFMLGKLREDKWPYAPKSARIIGKMKKVNPKMRTEPIIEALKKEILRSIDSNSPPQRPMESSYATESQYKICQYIYAIDDVGVSATPYASKALDTAIDNNSKEYLTICLGFTGDNKTLSPKIKTKIIHIAKNSTDGYARLMAMRVLEKWQDPNLIPIFKDGLNDDFKVAVSTDMITPDMYKGADGFYYYDYYPVRSEAFSALLKLGVKVENRGKGIYKLVE